jgi:transposase
MNGTIKAAIDLQAAIKRKQLQPLYNRQIQAARYNYDEPTLKQMSKPYLAVELKAAWIDELKNMTIYKKPLNKYKKHELYHELLNINYDFNNFTKKQIKQAKIQAEAPKRKRGRPKGSKNKPKVP